MLVDYMPKAYSGSEPYIFFSYSHKNQESIIRFVKMLSDAGFNVWYDEGIECGTKWDDYIADKLEGAALFISFVSRPYLESNICKDELRYAEKKNKNILIVFLDDARFTGGLEMRFDCYQSLIYSNYSNDEAFLNELTKSKIVMNCSNGCETINQQESNDSAKVNCVSSAAIEKHNILWGLSPKLRYKDPVYGALFDVGISGECGIKVKDEKCFSESIAGTDIDIYNIQYSKLIRVIAGNAIREEALNIITDNKISVIDLEERKSFISDKIKEKINDVFDKRGIELTEFSINTFVYPEDNSAYQALLKDVNASAEIVGIKADKRKENVEAVLQAENEEDVLDAKEIRTVKRAQMIEELKKEASVVKCVKCGADIMPGAKFCMECGASLVIKCIKCGAALAENAKFCYECGEKV